MDCEVWCGKISEIFYIPGKFQGIILRHAPKEAVEVTNAATLA